jgi:hypothetical protein
MAVSAPCLELLRLLKQSKTRFLCLQSVCLKSKNNQKKGCWSCCCSPKAHSEIVGWCMTSDIDRGPSRRLVDSFYCNDTQQQLGGSRLESCRVKEMHAPKPFHHRKAYWRRRHYCLWRSKKENNGSGCREPDPIHTFAAADWLCVNQM